MTVKIKHEIMRLDTKNSEVLFNALAAPVRFNDKLTAAFKEHAQRVTSRCSLYLIIEDFDRLDEKLICRVE